MANHARGETEIEVQGVGTVKLCMTIGAMAELEDAFEAKNLQEVLAKVGGDPSSRNMAKVLKALMVGTDHEDVDVEVIRRWPISPVAIRNAMEVVGDAGNEPPQENRQQRRAKAKAIPKK